MDKRYVKIVESGSAPAGLPCYWLVVVKKCRFKRQLVCDCPFEGHLFDRLATGRMIRCRFNQHLSIKVDQSVGSAQSIFVFRFDWACSLIRIVRSIDHKPYALPLLACSSHSKLRRVLDIHRNPVEYN